MDILRQEMGYKVLLSGSGVGFRVIFTTNPNGLETKGGGIF